MTFEEMKTQARTLSDDELARHAHVSTNNRHICRDCFCCACLEVKRERRADDEVARYIRRNSA